MEMNIAELNKEYCKCGKCGENAEVDTSVVLTSYPPKYNYHCTKCGYTGYVDCGKTFAILNIDKMSIDHQPTACMRIISEIEKLPVTLATDGYSYGRVIDKINELIDAVNKLGEYYENN